MSKRNTNGIPVIHDGLGSTAHGVHYSPESATEYHSGDGIYDNLSELNPADTGPTVHSEDGNDGFSPDPAD